MNEGVLMESFNLAVTWKLPVLFVCKDNDWSISTRSSQVTGGNLTERAASFGLNTYEADGFDVESVANSVKSIITNIRTEQHPAFLRAKCIHLEGHFLGDPLLGFKRTPIKQLSAQGIPMAKSALSIKGAPLKNRIISVKNIVKVISASTKDHFWDKKDPLQTTRKKLSENRDQLNELEMNVTSEIKTVLESGMIEYNAEIAKETYD